MRMPPVSGCDGQCCPGQALIVIPRPCHHDADKDDDIVSHNDDVDADDDADDARGER